jgi:hypothetical protein
MSDKLIYIHLSKGKIVETRMEIPTEPPLWGDDLDDWTAYAPNAEGKVMSDKTILETVYSTAEDLHKTGLMSDEMFALIIKSQKTEIERLQAEVDQLKFSRDIDEVGYDGTVSSDN